jgi:hypothetical protein
LVKKIFDTENTDEESLDPDDLLKELDRENEEVLKWPSYCVRCDEEDGQQHGKPRFKVLDEETIHRGDLSHFLEQNLRFDHK